MMICPHCHNPLSSDEADGLREENEKLRELVRDMAIFIALAGLDFRIRSHGKRELSASAFNRRMRELGVEVEG